MPAFYRLLANNLVAIIAGMTLWFAIVFYAYLRTQSVLVTSVISGMYLVAVAGTGFALGGIVDGNRKKTAMLYSSVASLACFVVAMAVYEILPESAFSSTTSVPLWTLVALTLAGCIAGNIRGVALPVAVTLLVPEESRAKANGLVGMSMGVAMTIVSAISGWLVALGGMRYALMVAVILTAGAMLHLWSIDVPEPEIARVDGKKPSVDVRGTITAIRGIPGLLALILFTTFNNFLGGAFMSLLDAYGLSMVSVQTWGMLWAIISTGFIFGGLVIAKKGLGKNPLRTLFLANFAIWGISCLFTIQQSVVLLTVGCFFYLLVAPFIEAAEHTVIQKVVPVERQGRVFGFAQSVESAASPLTAFLIGPITQFFFIPLMTDGAGARLIGNWFGTGHARGIALVFTLAGVVGLCVTMLAFRSRAYRLLSARYATAPAEVSATA